MSLVGKLVFSAFVSVNAFGVWKLFRFLYRQLTSPIRHLRGPKGTSWIYGNMLDIHKADATLYEEWVTQCGNTMKFKGFFNLDGVLTMDIRAINHVITHTSDYQKPPSVQYTLSQMLGKGILIVEGAQHRQQRRIMNPAFGPAQIRALTDIFLEKSVRLCDVLSSEIAKNPAGTTTGARIDIIPWLSRMALDVIGLAGFNYNFDALNANEKPNELNEAFATVNEVMQKLTTLSILEARFPLFRILPSDRARTTKISTRTMNRIGRELLSEAKAAARESATEKGEIEKKNLRGRDLFSLLVKANMATDIPESQRLSDEDVLAQVPTFLVAGHETTSTATTWALFAMTNTPETQMKLREELLSVDTETPSMDELMALPYLDAVVRETLRVHPPVPNGGRVAMKDDVIPVEKPYTDKHGVVHNSIRIRKGDPVIIPILAINRSRELWGPDAHEFKPERWQNIPDAVSQIPGVWGHLLSFLGGPRACIGYRFSIVEMKALLFTLIRAFEFELVVPASEIVQKAEVVQRPVLRSDPENKIQLPLLIKPYKRN
ncbi:cytochrome P450 [Boletus edulis BED1]|uniref:Cytochrome P450 n=1 Tax=Boletus edulis BED1 TaxID=1328754 RepID=A0AAD4C7D9_BOLED|nr:cytochrome P450 [Boletus edulis BED1]